MQKEKSDRARNAICSAAIQSLIEFGYSETSLNRIARLAGLSKGALQHHYASKEDLIAETANVLLSQSFTLLPTRRPLKTVEQTLMYSWKRFVRAPAYRALLEIFIAVRTDEDLRHRISSSLGDWRERLDRQAIDAFESVEGDGREVVLLLNMTRAFMRGLLIEEVYGVSEQRMQRALEKWISLVAPLLKLRQAK